MSEASLSQIGLTLRQGPRVLGLLWNTQRRLFSLVVFLTVLAGLIPALLLIATQALINQIQAAPREGMHPALISFACFIALTLSQEVIRILVGSFQSLYQNHLTNRINIQLMEKASKLPFSCFEDPGISDQLQRARQDSTYRPFQIFQQLLDLVGRSVTLVSVAGVLISWKWWLSAIILVLPFSSLMSFLKQGELEFMLDFQRTQKRRKHFYLLYLLTTDFSVKEIKLYQLGELLLRRYQDYCALFFEQDKRMLFRRTRLTLFFRTLTLVVVAGMQLCAVWEALNGKLSIGSLIAYLQAIGVTRTASSDLMQTLFSLCQHNLYVSQLFSFFDLPEKIDKKPPLEKASCGEVGEPQRGLEVRGLSFHYPGNPRKVLKNINFTLRPGETLAIVGENGSGKSTLVKLITRLYEAQEGEILYNGKPLEDYEEAEWSGKLGTVFQDFVKYEMTVRENIGYGDWRKMEEEARVIRAAEKSGASEVIRSLPQGLDTQLGKWFAEGSQLSGGQWQKVAIARAYMRDAEIYLLDEPTAALDPKAESEFFAHFRELTDRKMGVFISHRFATVRQASRILVLQKGEVVEEGTHPELMEKNGLYASLFRLQAAAFMDEATC